MGDIRRSPGRLLRRCESNRRRIGVNKSTAWPSSVLITSTSGTVYAPGASLRGSISRSKDVPKGGESSARRYAKSGIRGSRIPGPRLKLWSEDGHRRKIGSILQGLRVENETKQTGRQTSLAQVQQKRRVVRRLACTKWGLVEVLTSWKDMYQVYLANNGKKFMEHKPVYLWCFQAGKRCGRGRGASSRSYASPFQAPKALEINKYKQRPHGTSSPNPTPTCCSVLNPSSACYVLYSQYRFHNKCTFFVYSFPSRGSRTHDESSSVCLRV